MKINDSKEPVYYEWIDLRDLRRGRRSGPIAEVEELTSGELLLIDREDFAVIINSLFLNFYFTVKPDEGR